MNNLIEEYQVFYFSIGHDLFLPDNSNSLFILMQSFDVTQPLLLRVSLTF